MPSITFDIATRVTNRKDGTNTLKNLAGERRSRSSPQLHRNTEERAETAQGVPRPPPPNPNCAPYTPPDSRPGNPIGSSTLGHGSIS